MGGKKVAMLPSKYARELFRMPFAAGVCSHVQNSHHDSTVLSTAVRKVPAWEYVRRRGRIEDPELEREGPSKFEGLRRVIWRRTRSPVPGRMKVPFLSFCDGDGN